jgi:hypothetical protein
MGSAIRLTSRNAYDMMKMTRATGSRNEAPPMIVVFKNSFKGSFHLNNVIDAKMRPSRRLLQPYGRRFIRRLKAGFHSGRGVEIRMLDGANFEDSESSPRKSTRQLRACSGMPGSKPAAEVS